MLFRKIVRSFCLGVIFSFLGLAAALAQDQEPLTNADSGTVLFTKAPPYPFKGIDPAFTPPKDFMSELLMDPKRTLALMETDQATGTRFSLVRIVGGLPGGTPCVGGVNWPRGYEIVGEVPADVDLTNDTIAKPLVKTGRAALFNFCPTASTTETLTIWLFKGEIPTYQSYDYEVYASWEKQLPAAPGPRIKAEYHNKALEHAKRLVESQVREATPARRGTTSNEVDSYVPTITERTYFALQIKAIKEGDIKAITKGIVFFVELLLGIGFIIYLISEEYSSLGDASETDIPWVGGGMTGRKGEYTIIKDIKEHSIPEGSCSVTWEGNFGFTFEGEGEILESDIDGPTEIQMGNRVFEKNYFVTGGWEEK